MSITINSPIFDRTYSVYAFRDNNIKLVLTQGDGIAIDDPEDDITATRSKVAYFKLLSDQGAITLVSGVDEISWDIVRPDGSTDSLPCIVTTAPDTGETAVACPITISSTAIPGIAHGVIKVVTSGGSVFKFYGIDALVYGSAPEDAEMQSSRFSDLIAALQSVAALDASGEIATLDTVIAHGGTNPVASGIIYDYLTDNYMEINKSPTGGYNSNTDKYTVYYGSFGKYDNSASSTNQAQFRHDADGGVWSRTKTVSGSTWGDWERVASQNYSRVGSAPTTSTAGNLWDLLWYNDGTREHCYQLTGISGGTYTWTELSTGAWMDAKVDKTQRIAGLALSGNISADDLAKALEGKAIYFTTTNASAIGYTSASGTATSATKYPVPTIVQITDLSTFVLLYERTTSTAPYTYKAFHISKFSVLSQTFSNANYHGTIGEISVDSNGELRVWKDNSSYMSMMTCAPAVNSLSTYVVTHIPKGQLYGNSAFDKFYIKTGNAGESASGKQIALTEDIPTNVSDLLNDSGFLNSTDVQDAIAGKADLTTVTVPANSARTGPDTTSEAFTSLSIGQSFFCIIGGSRYMYIKTSSSAAYEAQPHRVSQLSNDAGYLTSNAIVDSADLASNSVAFNASFSSDHFMRKLCFEGDPPDTIYIDDLEGFDLSDTIGVKDDGSLYVITGYSTAGTLYVDVTWAKLATTSDVSSEVSASRPKYTTTTLLAANWSNNAYSLTLTGATANTKVDLNVNSTFYAALKSSGTERLWVENDNGTFTVHADGNVPTVDINVQLTLTEVNAV